MWSVTRLRLERSGFAQASRASPSKNSGLWPGVGPSRATRHDYAVRTLVGGAGGVEWFDRQVTRRIEQLPGFTGLRALTDRVAAVAPSCPASAA